MTLKTKQKILVIVGPTASGKTALSIALAKRFSGEIISADSRQIYRGLDLGTGKVTREEMDGVPHHLIDIRDPNETYTAHDFVHDAQNAISDIRSRHKLPIVVGGTFFYVDALLGNIVTPQIEPNETLRNELEQLSAEELFAQLMERDSKRAQTIDKHNKRRLVRALEIVDARGSVPPLVSEKRYDALVLGIHIEKDTLHKNIHERIVKRVLLGMIEEVEKLHENGLSYERMEDLGLEYRYISEYLRGNMTEEEALALLETKTRQYAKRQMTWLKRDTDITWVHPKNSEEASSRVEKFISAH